MDSEAGRLLRSLFERRSAADYDLTPVPGQEAERAIEDAGIVIRIVDDWLRANSK